MIRIDQPDGWIVFYDDDGATEIGRIKPPPNFTMAELEQFIEFFKRDAAKRSAGPS
jgi:hypothetical protein